MQQDNLVKTIRKEMELWFELQSADKGEIGGYCLLWAFHTVRVLRRAGLNAQIQAGTAFWPIVTPSQDDGVSPSRFGYEYEHGIHDLFRIAQGLLPEMHVWAAIADKATIIDVTTKYWPERCRLLIGEDWKAPKPPDYLWATALPKGVTYQPDVRAIKLAYQFLKMCDL